MPLLGKSWIYLQGNDVKDWAYVLKVERNKFHSRTEKLFVSSIVTHT